MRPYQKWSRQPIKSERSDCNWCETVNGHESENTHESEGGEKGSSQESWKAGTLLPTDGRKNLLTDSRGEKPPKHCREKRHSFTAGDQEMAH
jgi:hypothetical protein